MPPDLGHSTPSCAKQYAMAIEPTAVMIHDSSEIAPSWARFVGSMMIPDPIMLTATIVVRPAEVIFFAGSAIAGLLTAAGSRSGSGVRFGPGSNRSP